MEPDHPRRPNALADGSSVRAAVDGDRVRQLEHEVEQLKLALARRPSIEHVLGMIMLIMSCDEDTAFATLSHISQNVNRKIRDLTTMIRDCVVEGEPLPPDVADALVLISPPGRPSVS